MDRTCVFGCNRNTHHPPDCLYLEEVLVFGACLVETHVINTHHPHLRIILYQDDNGESFGVFNFGDGFGMA